MGGGSDGGWGFVAGFVTEPGVTLAGEEDAAARTGRENASAPRIIPRTAMEKLRRPLMDLFQKIAA